MSSEVVSESTVTIHAMTDVGRSRTHNEDNFIVCPDLSQKRWYLSDEAASLSSKGCLLMVADGMGGANAGEIASEIAVETVKHKFDSLALEGEIDEMQARDYLYQAILEAHKAIVAASEENPEYAGMGTTVLMAWVFSNKAVIGWCGDSRGYLYRRKKGLKILTKDHSLVWELVEAGKLTPDEADVHPDSNIITQSLGDKGRNPEPDFAVCALEEGDRLLLCSDGLNNMLPHQAIEQILAEAIPLAEVNQKLVKLANQNGGSDNITVLALDVCKMPSLKKKKSNKVLWLLPIIVVCFVIGWAFIYMEEKQASLSESLKQKNAGLKALQAGEEMESEEVVYPDSISSDSVDNQSSSEEDKFPLATEINLVLAKYHYLDSLVGLQVTNDTTMTSMDHTDSTSGKNQRLNSEALHQEKEELNYLIQKYHMGNHNEINAQQEFLDSLAEENQWSLNIVSADLKRIEILMNQIKTQN